MTVREALERYGPTMAVVVVLVLLVTLLPGNVDDRMGVGAGTGNGDFQAGDGSGGGGDATTVAAGGTGGTGGAGSGGAAGGAGGGGAGGGGGGGEGQAASARPSVDAATGYPLPQPGVVPEDTTHCRVDGRQAGIQLYMPPCAAPWPVGADNGGATARGVSADQVIVALYYAQEDAATQAALAAAGADDRRPDQERIRDAIRRYVNHHYQTYGREIVLVNIDASGPPDDEEAARADAIRIADEIGAFAAINGPQVMVEELAARGVVSVREISFSRHMYQRNPPYIFTIFPTIEMHYEHLAEYIGKRLAGRNAVHAGDTSNPLQGFNNRERRFGLIWIEGTGDRPDPDQKRARDFFVDQLAQYGVGLQADVGYQFDIARQQTQSANMISRMRQAEVTTLVFIGDALYPIFLTQEATRQRYFPEWIISGTLLVDTTFFGRTYDQAQWSNAFGISPLWVFYDDFRQRAGYREYHHMNPDANDGDEGASVDVIRSPISLVASGIHMAGPNLTADSFSDAMFSIDRANALGGNPFAPLVMFTRQDPTALTDFTEVFWNPTGRGNDELNNMGVGILMKAEGGRRYEHGQWPTHDPNVFTSEGAVFTANPPPGEGETFDHEQDGHQHDQSKPCLSCAPR